MASTGSMSERNTQLRAALVNTVETTPPRRRVRYRLWVAGVAAFALAGAGTGAVSAAAFAAGPPPAFKVNVHEMAASVVGTHATLYGTPFLLSGTGTTTVDLGPRPASATSVAIAISCGSAGTFKISVDGRQPSTTTCSQEDARSGHGGSGGEESVGAHGDHTIKIAAGSSRFVLWASWASEPAPPAESAAQQADLADGVVTPEEYSAAFDRFAACMSGAGHPLRDVDKTSVIYYFAYSDDDTGAYQQCYGAEFMKVDIAWQLAHQDQSDTATFLRRCLAAHGIAPAEHMADIQNQLAAAGLSPDTCLDAK